MPSVQVERFSPADLETHYIPVRMPFTPQLAQGPAIPTWE